MRLVSFFGYYRLRFDDQNFDDQTREQAKKTLDGSASLASHSRLQSGLWSGVGAGGGTGDEDPARAGCRGDDWPLSAWAVERDYGRGGRHGGARDAY